MEKKLDFAGAVDHIASLVGTEVSVDILGQDAVGQGVVAELSGVLREVGPDPDDPHWGESGPRVFGFVGQPTAVFLDPDAFVEAWAAEGCIRIKLTFGTFDLDGPRLRPPWF